MVSATRSATSVDLSTSSWGATGISAGRVPLSGVVSQHRAGQLF